AAREGERERRVPARVPGAPQLVVPADPLLAEDLADPRVPRAPRREPGAELRIEVLRGAGPPDLAQAEIRGLPRARAPPGPVGDHRLDLRGGRPGSQLAAVIVEAQREAAGLTHVDGPALAVERAHAHGGHPGREGLVRAALAEDHPRRSHGAH